MVRKKNMKIFLSIIALAVLVSCKKDVEPVTQVSKQNSANTISDSTTVLNIENPEYSGVFNVIPQNISAELGRAIFTQEGKTLFYFDQNSNKGIIKIDGKDYALDRIDFNENNYSLYGNNVKIEATNGDFKDTTGDCVYGDFLEVKVTLNGKTLNIPNIKVQDCPNF